MCSLEFLLITYMNQKVTGHQPSFSINWVKPIILQVFGDVEIVQVAICNDEEDKDKHNEVVTSKESD